MNARHLLLACSVFTLHAAGAQSIDDRIAASPTATVLLHYAARPDVCGDGRNIRFDDSDVGRWIGRCGYGPVRVRLGTDGGRITSIRTTVGAAATPSAAITDIGEVPPAEAAAWFLDLVVTATPRVAEDAILPAVIADAPDPWRELLAVAQNSAIAVDVRRSAVFWVGQSAARAATAELATIVDSDAAHTEIKKAAVFALARGDEPERGDHLMRIARTHQDREVVAAAFFWLADAPDVRALALFEEVLSGAAD